MSWLILAIIGAAIIGVFVGLFKVPSYKGYHSLAVLTFCFLTSGVVAIGLFHNSFSLTSPGVIICAAIWGLSFASLSALQMQALRYLDVGVLSPVTSALTLAATAVLSVVILAEPLSLAAWIGIALVILVIVGFQRSGRSLDATNLFTPKVLMLILAIVGLNTGYNFFLKYEVTYFSIEAIQLYQYFFAAAATIIFAFFGKTKLREVFSEHRLASLRWGMLLGSLSAIGGYAYYLSIERGPFAIASAINALYILIAVITAAIAFKEKLTWQRIGFVLLAVAAVILMQA